MIRKRTLSTLALFTCLTILIGTAHAQFPHTISYQGVIADGNTPVTGLASLTVNYYDSRTNVLLYSETFANVLLDKGVFNLELGSLNASVGSLFDAATPVEIGVRVNSGVEMQPRVKLTAAPYAFTAYSLLGVPASLTPINNTIFPLPVDGEGHIGTEVLPAVTLNGISMYDNNLRILAGRNMTVTTNGSTLTIDGPATPTITSVAGGAGILTGQSNGTVTVTSNVDASQFGYVNNSIHLRTDVPVIGTDAHFRSLAVQQDGYFGGGIITYGLETGSIFATSNVTVGGDLTVNRNLYASSDVLSVHVPAITLNDSRLQDVGYPVNYMDAANKSYVDSRDQAMSYMDGDIVGTTGGNSLNYGNEGIGDRLIYGVNLGSETIMDERITDNLTVNEGLVVNTPIDASTIGATTPAAANFTTMGSLGITTLATDGANVGIGTTTPTALLDVRGNGHDPATLQVINGTDATLRSISGEGNTSTLQLGDAGFHVGAIQTNDMSGMEFHMLTPASGEYTINSYNDHRLLTLGWDNNILFSAMTLDFGAARLQNVADPVNPMDAVNMQYLDQVLTAPVYDTNYSGHTLLATNLSLTGNLIATNEQSQGGASGTTASSRFADVVTIPSNNTTSVTINNSLVTPSSVIIMTAQTGENNKFSERIPVITSISTGSFTVTASSKWSSGDRLHYIIVN